MQLPTVLQDEMPTGYPPSVFVSSTCYDLGQVRIDLRQYLENAGFDALFSESPAFPVNPQIGTVENCVQVVRERADILVLVIGSRYGSQTPTGHSVTNLEYIAAKAKGVPIYAFVQSDVLAMLPVWKKNPLADYHGIVDTPKLFEFVDALRDTRDLWVFPFSQVADIISVLRHQLAHLFMEGLTFRSKFAQIPQLSSSSGLSNRALQIFVEKSFAWEAALFAAVLEDELSKCSNERLDLKYGLATGAIIKLPNREVAADWMKGKVSSLVGIAESLGRLFNLAFQDALGPPGSPGDADRIIYTARRVIAYYRELIEWTLAFSRVEGPHGAEKLFDLVSRFSQDIRVRIEELPERFGREIANALEVKKQGGTPAINVMVTPANPFSDEILNEMERIFDPG